MNKVNDSINTLLPYIKLYLNNIEEIVGILQKANPEKILFESNEIQFELHEIDKLEFYKTDNLKITAKFPLSTSKIIYNFSISFSFFGSIINCMTNDLQTQGLSREIEHLLKSNGRFLSKLIQPVVRLFLYITSSVILFFCALLLFMSGLSKINNSYINIIVITTIISSCLFISLKFYKNVIYLKRKKDLPSFFTRNKDQIVINIIIAILSFVMGKYL